MDPPDPVILEAPPSDLRQQVKSLAMLNRRAELLELAEQIMALPCSRAWLDLQRFVVEACTAMGDSYNLIAVAIRSELRTLLRDLPQLLDATLTDDTPAANSDATPIQGVRGGGNGPVAPQIEPACRVWSSGKREIPLRRRAVAKIATGSQSRRRVVQAPLVEWNPCF